MHPILQFYYNDDYFGENLGFTFSDICNAKHSWLEECHNYIQWAFPLKESSQFNPDAPLLTDEVIKHFSKCPTLRFRTQRLYQRMLQFFGFHLNHQWNQFIFDEVEVRSVDFMRENDFLWLNPNDHNFLRITRILKSLRLLGLENEAKYFYGLLSRLYSFPAYASIIGETTFNYWKEAMECGI